MEWNHKRDTDRHSCVYAYGAFLVELKGPKLRGQILDKGSGTGLTHSISPKCAYALGIYRSVEMVKKALIDTQSSNLSPLTSYASFTWHPRNPFPY